MLEILALVFICKFIGNIAHDKGRAAIGYQVLAVALWFAFEFIGAVVAGVFAIAITGSEDPGILYFYAGALAGAACSLFVSFGIVIALPSKADRYTDEPFEPHAMPGTMSQMPAVHDPLPQRRAI